MKLAQMMGQQKNPTHTHTNTTSTKNINIETLMATQ